MSLYTVSALDAIREYGKRHGIEVEYAQGCTASRFLPALDRLARSAQGNKNPYDLRYFGGDPNVLKSEPTMTLNVPFSSGCMVSPYWLTLLTHSLTNILETLFPASSTCDWRLSSRQTRMVCGSLG